MEMRLAVLRMPRNVWQSTFRHALHPSLSLSLSLLTLLAHLGYILTSITCSLAFFNKCEIHRSLPTDSMRLMFDSRIRLLDTFRYDTERKEKKLFSLLYLCKEKDQSCRALRIDILFQ
jgi:hypothetical protein